MFLGRHLDRRPFPKRTGVESPLIRAATSSVLLTTRSRAARKEATPHPYYGRKLLTQRVLDQIEREATIKPTATIGTNKGLDEASGSRKRAVYLNDTRTVSKRNVCQSVRLLLSELLFSFRIYVVKALRSCLARTGTEKPTSDVYILHT